MSRPAALLGLVALLSLLASAFLWAELYRVEGGVGDVYIKTRWCYVYAYSEDSVIDTDDMVIHFLDSNDECDIEKILVGR